MNVVLLIFLIWIPLDGAVEGSVTSDYLKQTYATEAECTAAKEGDTQIFWNSKPGFRMLGTKQCTDGNLPNAVTIGSITVTVDPPSATE